MRKSPCLWEGLDQWANYSPPGHFHKHLLPEMKVDVGINASLGTRDNSEGDTSFRIGKNIQQMDDVEQTQQPKWRWASNTIHDAMLHPLQILNAALDGVLVLLMRLGLFVFNDIHTKQIFHLERSLQFCIIGLQTLHGTVITDEVLQCCGHLGLQGHGVACEQLRDEPAVDLNEAAPTMPRDPVIIGGNVGDETVSWLSTIPVGDGHWQQENGTGNVCTSGHAGRPCSTEWFSREFHECALSPPSQTWVGGHRDQEGNEARRKLNGGQKRVGLV